MSSRWGDFEHQFWNALKESRLENAESYLIAVSGGVDSMALLLTLARVRPQSRIRVAHFHHGPSADSEQLRYRDHVADFVKHKISVFNSLQETTYPIEFIFDRSDQELRSEADMREARWHFLRRVRVNEQEPILTGHHLDDWFETVLMKMMRGASMDGMTTFQMWNLEIFRPFIHLSKAEILKYASQQKLSYLDDPSNLSSDYLRNWVREQWLPQLELRQSGSVANLSRSLLQMIEEFSESSTFELKFYEENPTMGLDRAWYLTLSSSEQIKALALFLKKHQVYEFTRGQLQEIMKRLDKNQKDLTFEIIDRKWVINASQIMLQLR